MSTFNFPLKLVIMMCNPIKPTCSSKGKYLTLILQELWSIVGASHVLVPLWLTLILVFILSWAPSLSSSALIIINKKKKHTLFLVSPWRIQKCIIISIYPGLCLLGTISLCHIITLILSQNVWLAKEWGIDVFSFMLFYYSVNVMVYVLALTLPLIVLIH